MIILCRKCLNYYRTFEHIDQFFQTTLYAKSTFSFVFLVNEIDYKNHSISWNDRNIATSDFRHPFLQFDGNPYMIVGMYYMTCQYGQDPQQTKKEKYKKMKVQYLFTRHYFQFSGKTSRSCFYSTYIGCLFIKGSLCILFKKMWLSAGKWRLWSRTNSIAFIKNERSLIAF